jgi:hypothetical protein
MQHPIVRFLLFWGLNTLVLWVAGELFASVRFDSWTAPGAVRADVRTAHALLPVLVI